MFVSSICWQTYSNEFSYLQSPIWVYNLRCAFTFTAHICVKTITKFQYSKRKIVHFSNIKNYLNKCAKFQLLFCLLPKVRKNHKMYWQSCCKFFFDTKAYIIVCKYKKQIFCSLNTVQNICYCYAFECISLIGLTIEIYDCESFSSPSVLFFFGAIDKSMKNKQTIATMVTVQEKKECARNALAMIGHPENLSLVALHNHNFLSFAHGKSVKIWNE